MFEIMNAWLEAGRFGADIQRVIALRMFRLSAGGPLAASEARRMVSEKVVAFAELQGTLMSDLASGRHTSAATLSAPFRRRVRANRRRLES